MARTLNNYVKAFIPEPYRILGVRLRSFSLGHYFLMQRFGCAFASESEDSMGGIGDLLLGIVICSRTYEDFMEFIEDDDNFNKWMKRWGKEVMRASKKDKNFNILHKMMSFQEYMKNGIVIPKYFEGDNSEEGSSSGAHWTQSVMLVATSKLGYSHSEALNSPLSKVLADYFKWSETEGIVTLMGDDELEVVEEMEKANG